MLTAATILFLLVLAALIAINVVGLPGNWIALVLSLVWAWAWPEVTYSAGFVALLVGVCLIGEAIEFAAQYYGAKRYGATGRGNLGGMIGAIIGALLGAGFGFGLGALPGAMLGAFLGCYLFETRHGRTAAEAKVAAWGAMWGRFFGLAAKLGVGLTVVSLTAARIWPV